MVPTPTALIACVPRPLIGWGEMGRMEAKSERKGEMWQVAPVSMIKGREEAEGVIEEKRDWEEVESAVEGARSVLQDTKKA